MHYSDLKSSYLPTMALDAGLKIRRNGREFSSLCPSHMESNPSFRMYTKCGFWRYICFSCGVRGDAIDFYNKFLKPRGLKVTTSISYDTPKDPYEGWSIRRPPNGERIHSGQPVRVMNVKRGRLVTYCPEETYLYDDIEARPLGYVLRLTVMGNKFTPQVWWSRAGSYEGWAVLPYPHPRPLYGLGGLAKRPSAPVLIVEGEKCKDAAQRLVGSDYCPVTWIGGSQSFRKAKWETIKGRECVLWPDMDEHGSKAMDAISSTLRGLGCKTSFVRLTAGDVPRGVERVGMDIADLEFLGASTINSLIRNRSCV